MNNQDVTVDVTIEFHGPCDADGPERASRILRDIARNVMDKRFEASTLYRGEDGYKEGGLDMRGVHCCDTGHFTTHPLRYFPLAGDGRAKLCQEHYQTLHRAHPETPFWDEAKPVEDPNSSPAADKAPASEDDGRWYVVPAYRQASDGIDSMPHILNEHGGLVGVFEDMGEAREAAKAHNNARK